MQEMMDLRLSKQRREEMLREAEMNRQARALRAAGNGRAGRRSTHRSISCPCCSGMAPDCLTIQVTNESRWNEPG